MSVARKEPIRHTYDAGSRLTQAVDSITGTITRGYDNLNRLTSEATPQGTVSYTYDNAGRRSTMTVAGQPVVNYSYDSANRVTQITQGTSSVAFGYDAAGRRASLKLPNGVAVSYSYDTASQLTGMSYASASTTLGNLAYSYDLAGRRAQVGGSFTRTGLPLPVSTTAYNVDNQLTQWGTATLTYDANGNILSNGTDGYSWDARNRLVSTLSGASFQYDPFGRRTSKTVAGTASSFLYDGVNVVQELVGGTPTANLLTGGVDEVFTRTEATGPRSFLADALGSTLALTDSTGAIQTQYTYEPFGNTTMTGSSVNPFQFTGRENDGTGLYFHRARYYNPTLQRFTSEDPFGFRGGINLYAYVNNRPVNLRDPFGNQIEVLVVGGPVGWAIAGGIAVTAAYLYLQTPAGQQAVQNVANDIADAIDRAIPRAPTRPKEKCGRVARCDLWLVGPGYCVYHCEDGSTVYDASCIPFFYKPWGEKFPREYPDIGP